MNLISLNFIAFCFVTVAIFYLLPQKARWVWLLIMNIVFYACAGVQQIVFILATSVISYAGCLWLAKLNQKEDADLKNRRQKLSREAKKQLKGAYERKRKAAFTVLLILVLGQLVWLKYGDFLLYNVNAIFHTDVLSLGMVMPLGISFYTVFCIGYCIDVYRGQYKVQKNLLKHIAVITFFPCVTQGPIERYDHLSEQIFSESRLEWTRLTAGAQLMLWGFFKKLVIADNLSVVTNTVFMDETGTFKGLYILLAALVYAVVLYADFSGYTDIVRGLSQMLGISLVRNFDSPYFSLDIAEYWRRWHMSLGKWFKDYVFYSILRSAWCQKLGKWSAKKFSRTVSMNLTTTVGLLINWTLIGFWHGASWKYVAHGLYFGCIMIFSVWMKPVYEKVIKLLRIKTDCFSWHLFQGLRTFSIVVFGYILFCAKGFVHFVGLVKDMVSGFNPWIFFDGGIFSMGVDQKSAFILAIAIILLFVVDILHIKGHQLRAEIAEQNLLFRWLLLYGIIFAIIIFGAYGSAYNAADFIYQGF